MEHYIACTQGDETYVSGYIDGILGTYSPQRVTKSGTYQKAELSNLIETHGKHLYQASPGYFTLINKILEVFWKEGAKSSGRKVSLLKADFRDSEQRLSLERLVKRFASEGKPIVYR